MTKPLAKEEKERRQAERDAAAAEKAKAERSKKATVDTTIVAIENQFPTYITNVGTGVMQELCDQFRKAQKEGVFEDSWDGLIKIRLFKEGLKATFKVNTNVTVKEVHKDEWTPLVIDPVQPELPFCGDESHSSSEPPSGEEQPEEQTEGGEQAQG